VFEARKNVAQDLKSVDVDHAINHLTSSSI